MSEVLRQLCGLSLFCGIALGLMPEGGVKKAAAIACTVVLVMTVLLPLGSLNLSQYSLELAKYREMGEQLEEKGSEVRDSMNRTVIEQECEAYIMDKAEVLGIDVDQVNVRAFWNSEGVWVPESAEIRSGCGESEKKRLADVIFADLGIPAEKLKWSGNE
ncbi:MAG: hypothetical protein ACI3VA_00380 [Candidatus Limivicinus sp.]